MRRLPKHVTILSSKYAVDIVSPLAIPSRGINNNGINDVTPIGIHNDIHHTIINIVNPIILHCSGFIPNDDTIDDTIIPIKGPLTKEQSLALFINNNRVDLIVNSTTMVTRVLLQLLQYYSKIINAVGMK